MSLFDQATVTPPTPCSRCGHVVLATSLFCPECGQSMLRPRAPQTPPAADLPEVPEPTPPAAPEEAPPAATTGWLRRSLNLGKKPVEAPPAEAHTDATPAVLQTSDLQATQQMSLFEIEQAEAVAVEKAQKRQGAAARFVLAFEVGPPVTVGENPGVIGVKPAQEGEAVFRICVDDPTDTVAPEHLEFGVEKGVFWVQDLKTVNGTIVEEPGATPIQCAPYEKYFVVRGSQVRMGQLGFTLN